ncbi:hypothetical protein COO91_02604 [Nostoc flagelliforme CCNUN1]|uniref:Uncharacterized protein n=1 Tax=Nostoc flagelliforme CCNUN1 TaxID=2038116 RepID=A0A2K8SMZ6_9NOSO|nr:hypothetical protein COO91_02604 [Nostoc flagelliforme CCNUN1]
MSPINLRLTRSHFPTQQSSNNHSCLSDRIASGSVKLRDCISWLYCRQLI